jgi:hypothetical protein
LKWLDWQVTKEKWSGDAETSPTVVLNYERSLEQWKH